jgi:peptidoglycan/LPS O-acetylase OafA/YrhL
MADAHELVDPAKVSLLLAVLSGASLVAALVLFIRGRTNQGARRAALIAAAGVLLFPMWHVYNSIENHFGLDSVAALLINLALFAFLGTVGGIMFGRRSPGELHHGDTESTEAPRRRH